MACRVLHLKLLASRVQPAILGWSKRTLNSAAAKISSSSHPSQRRSLQSSCHSRSRIECLTAVSQSPPKCRSTTRHPAIPWPSSKHTQSRRLARTTTPGFRAQGFSTSAEASGVQGESGAESAASSDRLIIYSKPGCCLCDGLKEKIEAMFLLADKGPLEGVELEVRDITTREEWFEAYQYEIPVMTRRAANGNETLIPRQSPRVSVDRLKQHLQAAFSAPA